jgi:hypothetical protein
VDEAGPTGGTGHRRDNETGDELGQREPGRFGERGVHEEREHEDAGPDGTRG